MNLYRVCVTTAFSPDPMPLYVQAPDLLGAVRCVNEKWKGHRPVRSVEFLTAVVEILSASEEARK